MFFGLHDLVDVDDVVPYEMDDSCGTILSLCEYNDE